MRHSPLGTTLLSRALSLLSLRGERCTVFAVLSQYTAAMEAVQLQTRGKKLLIAVQLQTRGKKLLIAVQLQTRGKTVNSCAATNTGKNC